MNKYELLLYKTSKEDVSVNAVVMDESIWLSQKGMAKLFDCSPSNISIHLKNIFADNELTQKEVCKKIPLIADDRKKI